MQTHQLHLNSHGVQNVHTRCCQLLGHWKNGFGQNTSLSKYSKVRRNFWPTKIIALCVFSVEELLPKDWQHILKQNFLTNCVNDMHAILHCFARIQARRQCGFVPQICWVYTQSSRILYTPLDPQTSSFFAPIKPESQPKKRGRGFKDQGMPL